jgi:hypothetical protein
MNSFLKIIYAILAGCNVIFSLFSPLAIVILWILQFGTSHWGSQLIIILGLLTTIYKALDYLTIKENY